MASSLLQRLALRGICPPTSANLGQRSGGLLAIQNAPAARTTASAARTAAVPPAVTKTANVPHVASRQIPARSADKLLPAEVASGDLVKLVGKRKCVASTRPAVVEVQPKSAPKGASGKRGRPPKCTAIVPVRAANVAAFEAPQLVINCGEVARPSHHKGLRKSPLGKLNRKSLQQSPLGKAMLCQSPLAKRKKKRRVSTPVPLASAPSLEADAFLVAPQQVSSKRARKATEQQARSQTSRQPRLLATPQRRSVGEERGRPLSPPPLLATSQIRHSQECLPESAKSPKMSFNSTMEQCGICCEDVEASCAIRLRCQHGWYCTQCMSRHVEARLDTGTVQQTCPECNVELAERDLKRMISSVLMDRLLARSLEQAVASTAGLRPCPTPNCPMRVALEADESGQFVCTECRKGSCLKCGAQPYHKRLTCEQHAAKAHKSKRCSFLKWMDKTGAKQCPSCQMAVTKQDLNKQGTQSAECHKMLCRNCNTRFCFKCLAVLSDKFSCGCSKDKHGFVDPHTGKYIQHLKPNAKRRSDDGSAGRHNWRDRAGGA